MPQKLFPVRKKCLRCGRTLGRTPGDPVYDGLYCSPSCARIAAPPRTPDQAPRECRAMHDGQWVLKRRYRSISEIPQRILDDPSAEQYLCPACHHWHTGHSRLRGAERFRILSDRSQLADVLVKARGRATRKQVAAAAGVRPIRLAELEEPGRGGFDPDALFAVMRVLHLRPGVAIEGGRP